MPELGLGDTEASLITTAQLFVVLSVLRVLTISNLEELFARDPVMAVTGLSVDLFVFCSRNA
jgi:hypothetical protein